MSGADGVVSVACPAKLNLHLQVVGRRADGYHELRTIFQTIDLADQLEIELTDDGRVELEVGGPCGVGLSSGPDNLVVRAARRGLDLWGRGQGVRCRLVKQIPFGAGLGGGSSDAAATLNTLRRLLAKDSPQTTAECWRVARELGADVGFFLVGGTALGVGRGDEVVPLPPLPPRRLGLLLPAIEISSAAVFRSLAAPNVSAIAPALLPTANEAAWRWSALDTAWNDLQDPVFALEPRLETLARRLAAAGASRVQLSGSGSALFGLFEGEPPDRLDGLPDDCRYLVVETTPG